MAAHSPKDLQALEARVIKVIRTLESVRLLLENKDFDAARLIMDSATAEFLLLSDQMHGRPAGKTTAQIPERETSREAEMSTDINASVLEEYAARFFESLRLLLTAPIEFWRTIGLPMRAVFFIIFLCPFVYGAYRLYENTRLRDHGLVGEYFGDRDLQSFAEKRIDKNINFRWGFLSPLDHFKADDFSVRWTGFLVVDSEDEYEFFAYVDDGARVWIDDTQVIDEWRVHAGTLAQGKIRLSPGAHRIKVEYFEALGDTVIKLYWKSSKQGYRRIIPPDNFYPDESHLPR